MLLLERSAPAMLPPPDLPEGHSTPDQTSPANRRGGTHVDHVSQVADSIPSTSFVCPAWSLVCVEEFPANSGGLTLAYCSASEERIAGQRDQRSEFGGIDILLERTNLPSDEPSVNLLDVLLLPLSALGGARKSVADCFRDQSCVTGWATAKTASSLSDVCVSNDHTIDEPDNGLLQGFGARLFVIEL